MHARCTRVITCGSWQWSSMGMYVTFKGATGSARCSIPSSIVLTFTTKPAVWPPTVDICDVTAAAKKNTNKNKKQKTHTTNKGLLQRYSD